MWEKTLHMRRDPYTMTQIKNLKEFMEKQAKEEIKNLKDEGIETQTIPGLKKEKIKSF